MAGHEIDVILIVFIHAAALRNDIAYEFMIFFKPAFLIRYIWILKLGTVVREDYRKILSKGPQSYGISKTVDSIDHTFLRASWKKYYKHKTTASE